MTFDWIPGRTALVLCAAAAIVACGGGGGGGGGAAFTDASVGAGDDPKELAFSWNFDGSADAFRLEANPDGASGFTPVDVNGDGTVDADDELAGSQSALDLPIPLHLTDFLNALYQVVALDSDGSELDRSDELSIMGIVVEELIGYFKASNTDLGDEFGFSVALSGDGDTLAVGGPREDGTRTGVTAGSPDDTDTGDGAGESGAVYVFTRNWSQQAYVKASNTGNGDNFGISVALSGDGDTLAVGADREDGADSDVTAGSPDNDSTGDGVDDAGAVYVFTRDSAGTWSQQAYVKASNTDDLNAFFGRTVALSDDGQTLAVGAVGDDGPGTDIISGDPGDGTTGDGAPGAGAVYVFTRDGSGTWSQQAYVKASNTSEADDFGESVSLSANGDTLAVGASDEDGDLTGVTAGDPADGTTGDGTSNAGAVYVFTRDSAGTWSQQAYVKASNTDNGDAFGTSVALSASGDTLAVGANNEDGDLTGVTAGSPEETTTGDGTGSSGAVYVFTRDSVGTWVQQAYVKASNAGLGHFFGTDVALADDGDALAVGAREENSAAIGVDGNQNDDCGTASPANCADGAGAAYLFTRDGAGMWSQQAYVKASNTDAFDFFGASVALSGDDDTLAVGARFEGSNATGIDGDQTDDSLDDAGAVYLY